MRRTSLVILIGMITILLAAAGSYAAEMMSGAGMSTHKASNLIGTDVINKQGETLGKIGDLVLDARGERVTFAIISESRMLGLSEKLIPVPINALTFKDEKTAIIDISKEKLATAPSFEKNKWPDMTNRQWSDDTHRFYGVQPRWEEKSMEKIMKEEMPMKEEMKEKVYERKEKSGY